ncbi:MAG TPA: SURF1 family protein [Gemmatimonadaceae bacterium]|nr:SURF1 family protein [Gemmatimonadaceae bacterium]
MALEVHDHPPDYIEGFRRSMRMRQWVALLIGVLVAAACIRLGFWQLDRRADRSAHNDTVHARTAAPPVPLSQLGLPADSLQYQRVLVRGQWDYHHELALTGRSHNGSPGVHIITPFIPNGIENAVLVNRGWVYAPDAAVIDFDRWRVEDSTAFIAYVELFPPPGERSPRSTRSPRSWHRIDTAAISRDLPYAIEPYYLVALPDSGALPAADRPARLAIPAIGTGPHLSYAVQWFAFATIALVGSMILIWRDRRTGSG